MALVDRECVSWHSSISAQWLTLNEILDCSASTRQVVVHTRKLEVVACVVCTSEPSCFQKNTCAVWNSTHPPSLPRTFSVSFRIGFIQKVLRWLRCASTNSGVGLRSACGNRGCRMRNNGCFVKDGRDQCDVSDGFGSVSSVSGQSSRAGPSVPGHVRFAPSCQMLSTRCRLPEGKILDPSEWKLAACLVRKMWQCQRVSRSLHAKLREYKASLLAKGRTAKPATKTGLII